jgi:hypothetical protein
MFQRDTNGRYNGAHETGVGNKHAIYIRARHAGGFGTLQVIQNAQLLK